MLVGVEPGSELAGYRIERVLATGGTCIVYLAHDPVLPRLDALKVLGADLSKDAALRERFIRESDTGARLHHPNIVSIYSRGEAEDGQLWIAMQYVAGIDAEAALASGTMTPPRALRIVREVAKALDYAHRLNLVHNDVKPSNFLLSAEADSGEEHVLLTDFGISRTIGQPASSTGAVPVTLSLAYAAPEVIVGDAVTGSADIYSLGCTLFRLLTGKHVFAQAEGTSELVEAHLRSPAPRISDFMSGSSPQLDSVVAKALAKDPDQRFHSARELADAATEALEHTVPRGGTARAAQIPSSARPPQTYGESGGEPPYAGEFGPPPHGLKLPPPDRTARANSAHPFSSSSRRHPISAPNVPPRVLLAGGAILAAVATVVGLAIARSGPTAPPPPAAQPTTSSTAAPPPKPDPIAQAHLSGLLPPGYPPGVCTQGEITATATATVLCGPNTDPGGPTSATYMLAPDGPTLQAAMKDLLHRTQPVVCPPNILSPGPWHRVETPTTPMGLVFCGIRSGRALVAWTNDPERLLCITESGNAGPTLDQLFIWWTSHS